MPGSGKTTYANLLKQEGWALYDDFQARAARDSADFRSSRYYAALLDHIRAGRRCIVSDIRVIYEKYRIGALAALRQDVGDVPTELHLFENNPDRCAENVRDANDGRGAKPRLQAIAFWSKYYSAPNHAVLHQVWRPATGPDLDEA